MKMFGREVSPPKCPTCGHALNLGRYSPKRITDEYGDWYWGCEGCGYLRWTVFEKETKTVQEIIEEYESTRRRKNMSMKSKQIEEILNNDNNKFTRAQLEAMTPAKISALWEKATGGFFA